MKKNLIVVLIIISSINSLDAQNVNYYRLIKIIKEGKEIGNPTGGQFLSFSGSYCYESDSEGFSVGNGKLEYKNNDNGFITYVGNSYWGKSIFRFNSNKSRLNVLTDSDLIYVYEISKAPSGVTTCSLIKSKSSSQGQVSGGYVGGYYPPINGGSYNTGSNNSSTQSANSQSSSSSTTKNQPTRHKCSRCNGKGRIAIETHPPMFGQEDYKERCSECGGYFLHSSGHAHVNCSLCYGKGYFTTD